MQRFLTLTALSLAVWLVSTSAQAQNTKPESLPDWEQLSPAQRELLIAPTRDRWNREPEKRQQFLEYAKRWQSMPSPERSHARRGMERWENMSPEQRNEARAIYHATRSMSKDERRDFFEKWRQMSLQQRTEWLKNHPAPEHRKDN